MLSSTFIDNVEKLSWAARVSYIILVFAIWTNMRNVFEHSIDAPWRRMYFYKGAVSLLGFAYFTFLLTGLINIVDFAVLLRWLQPLILSGLCTSAILHRWEISGLKEKKIQEERLKAVLEVDDEKES